jgi:cytochrome c553
MVWRLDADSARVFSGDAARGRDLFLDITQELRSCTNCHAVGGKGVNIAPRLNSIPSGASALQSMATRK